MNDRNAQLRAFEVAKALLRPVHWSSPIDLCVVHGKDCPRCGGPIFVWKPEGSGSQWRASSAGPRTCPPCYARTYYGPPTAAAYHRAFAKAHPFFQLAINIFGPLSRV